LTPGTAFEQAYRLSAAGFSRCLPDLVALHLDWKIATLTILGLIIGFTFSMAVSRYDQRKHYEELEASAIGTEHLRADLLPAAEASQVRTLLKSYLDERIRATALPNPVMALAVAGMNDVANAAGSAQAAWRTRIPNGAWILMALIAILSNLVIGYGALQRDFLSIPPLVLPLVVSISLLLIADLDSPHGGVIQVVPHNLLSLADSLRQ
jgi:hypothetical protein